MVIPLDIIPLYFPTSSRLPDFGKGVMLQVSYCFVITCFMSILFENLRMILLRFLQQNLQYIWISSGLLSIVHVHVVSADGLYIVEIYIFFVIVIVIVIAP